MSAPEQNDKGQRRYGVWAGNPKDRPEDKACCIEQVFPQTGWIHYQCTRKRGHGPNGEYCKQHASKATP